MAPDKPNIPRQRIHIDICALPSLTPLKRPIRQLYAMVPGLAHVRLTTQTLEEALVDKMIALAYRNRLMPRDLWDVMWLKMRGVRPNTELLTQKLAIRDKTRDDCQARLEHVATRLRTPDLWYPEFKHEMARFIPRRIYVRTLDDPEYGQYLAEDIGEVVHAFTVTAPQSEFHKRFGF